MPWKMAIFRADKLGLAGPKGLRATAGTGGPSFVGRERVGGPPGAHHDTEIAGYEDMDSDRLDVWSQLRRKLDIGYRSAPVRRKSARCRPHKIHQKIEELIDYSRFSVAARWTVFKVYLSRKPCCPSAKLG